MGTFLVRILKSYRTQKDTRKSNMPNTLNTLFLLCLSMCADVLTVVCMWSQRTACGSRFSPSIVWVMGVELTLPALATSPLPTEPSQNSLK